MGRKWGVKKANACLIAIIVTIVVLLAELANCEITTVTYQISAGADDGFAWSDTGQDVTSGYLTIGDGAYAAPYYMSGMRFVGVGVPRSASIVSANLRFFTGADENRGQIYGLIEGEAVDDAAGFGGRYISSAIRTSASISWDHKFAWDDGIWLISPDVSALVRDVIGRGGWSSGNSLAMFYWWTDFWR